MKLSIPESKTENSDTPDKGEGILGSIAIVGYDIPITNIKFQIGDITILSISVAKKFKFVDQYETLLIKLNELSVYSQLVP